MCAALVQQRDPRTARQDEERVRRPCSGQELRLSRGWCACAIVISLTNDFPYCVCLFHASMHQLGEMINVCRGTGYSASPNYEQLKTLLAQMKLRRAVSTHHVADFVMFCTVSFCLVLYCYVSFCTCLCLAPIRIHPKPKINRGSNHLLERQRQQSLNRCLSLRHLPSLTKRVNPVPLHRADDSATSIPKRRKWHPSAAKWPMPPHRILLLLPSMKPRVRRHHRLPSLHQAPLPCRLVVVLVVAASIILFCIPQCVCPRC